MNSERQKREEEIERLMKGAGLSPEAEIAFREQVKKASSAIFEQETTKIEKDAHSESDNRSISPLTIGLWIVILGIGLTFVMPPLGGLLLLCGFAVIAWATLMKSSKRKSSRRSDSTD